MGRNGQLPAVVRHHGHQDETGTATVVRMPVVASGQLGDTGNPNIGIKRLICASNGFPKTLSPALNAQE